MTLSPVSVDLIIYGLAVAGISSFFTSVNFFSTIVNMRLFGSINGGTFLTLLNAGILITAVMLLLTLPILSGGLLMLLADLHFNTIFFDSSFGGDPVMYQHLFWFFGHPEVYILIVPGFGIISQAISSISQKTLFGNQCMVLAMSCISVLGSIVWGHHIFTVGFEADTRAYFTGITILISLPSGTKVFNWLCTYQGNALRNLTNTTLFGLIFLVMFTLGGSSGVVLGNAALDSGLHDTYYVVAHFHFVLSLGAIIALFSGVKFLQESLKGTSSMQKGNSINARYHLFLTFVGINLTFTPMHLLGFNVMPRRMTDFPDYFNSWNYLSSIGSGLTLLGFVYTVLNHLSCPEPIYNIIRCKQKPRKSV